MPNDCIAIDLDEVFQHFSKASIAQCVTQHLKTMTTLPAPKNTLHLDKLKQKHEEAVFMLQSLLGQNDSNKLFYEIKHWIKTEQKTTWTFTKYHLEQVQKALEKDEFEIAKKLFYACGYMQFICLFCMQFPNQSDVFNQQIRQLIAIHEEMIRDIEKIIKDTRIRAMFNS